MGFQQMNLSKWLNVSPGGLLLSIADRRGARKLRPENFERVLINAILFEPQILVPDVYFFNSPAILEHIKKHREGPSLLELALQQSIVLPAIRESANNFRQVAEYLHQANIYGLLPREDIDYLAERLSARVHRQELGVLWPERMASSYANLLVRVLQRDTAPGSDYIQVNEGLWRDTEVFRIDALNEALADEARRPGGYGVRRAEVIRKSAERVGILSARDELPTENEIIARYTGPASGRKAIARFFDWLDELYFANQALRFGVRPTTSTSHVADLSLIAEAANLPANDTVGLSQQNQQMLEMQVGIPAFDTLRALPPQRLLKLREYGVHWYASAGAFMRDPSTTTRLQAEWALESFARSLNREAHSTSLETVDAVLVSRSFAYASMEAALEFLQFAASIPPLHTLISVTKTGYLAMRYRRKPKTEKFHASMAPGQAVRFVLMDPQAPG